MIISRRYRPQSEWFVKTWTSLSHLTSPYHCSLRYLLSYDAITFHSYLEAILTAATPPPGSGPSTNPRGVNQSPWLYLDAANTLFHVAKRRAYIPPPKKKKAPPVASVPRDPLDMDEDEEAEEALREAERAERESTGFRAGPDGRRDWEKTRKGQMWPPGVEPVLEELPKWGLLASVLEEIEEDITVAKHSERREWLCVWFIRVFEEVLSPLLMGAKTLWMVMS